MVVRELWREKHQRPAEAEAAPVDTRVALVVEKTYVISSVHIPWWYLQACPASKPSLLKITDFTLFYACMLWLMYCAIKNKNLNIELKCMVYVLYMLKL